MSQLFAPGGQSIGVSASTSVLPMNIQDTHLGGEATDQGAPVGATMLSLGSELGWEASQP